MTHEELSDFIREQDALLRTVKKLEYTDRERVYARMIKLGEEYGEVCDAVLAYFGDQRSDKLETEKAKETLEGELADVVIVVYLLATALEVDMDKALLEKMKHIREKHNVTLKRSL